ncbi:MAG: GNAT family N-acetyltransferase [Sporichthyaceae bacterium]
MSGYSGARPLRADDSTTEFSCGTPSLDDYLHRRAFANQAADLARCYVTLHRDRVVGFYALATGAVLRQDIPSRLRKNTPPAVPVLVIGRLAVDLEHRGRGLGGGLVRDAVIRCVAAADIAGIKAVIVHTQNETAAAFWRHYDFDPMPGNDAHLMLPIADARAAMRKS